MSVGSFQKKVADETLHRDKLRNLNTKELQRQSQIITSKQLKNNESYIAFVFGLVGVIFTLFPAGIEVQMQIWYILSTLISGILGYYFSVKASRLNQKYFRQYRLKVHLKITQLALYFSAFAIFGSIIMTMFTLSLYF
ncbi:MAG: hypothetical protein ACLSXC_08755 [Beduini sp.]